MQMQMQIKGRLDPADHLSAVCVLQMVLKAVRMELQ